ncbi:MAG: hypothetical protein ABI437_22665 [Kofleriaceae bacterium]
MLCPNCGFDGGRIFNFCSSCGRKVPSGVAVSRDDGVAGSRALRWIVFGSTLVVPVVGIVMGARYVVDPRLPQRALGRWWLALGVVVALVDAWWLLR